MTTSPSGPLGDVSIDPNAQWGYTRSAELQAQFERAAAALLDRDGWVDPNGSGAKELRADLALEGGGVKGIGLVGAVLVLTEAGYTFRGVAGTSAGAIAAALIAGIVKAAKPMVTLKGYLDGLDFTKFMPEGKFRHFLDHDLGKAGSIVNDVAVLAHQMGLYSGDFLEQWLTPIMHDDLGVTSFADLRLTEQQDPGMSLPVGHQYSLVVHTADITRAQLVHLPWDYPVYGRNPDEQDVVGAIRASMSIPFFFEPVEFEAFPTDVEIPRPGGGTIAQHYDGGSVTWVDGGMLRNFPINAFDRVEGAPRWPTIGIKLSSLQTTFPVTGGCKSSVDVGVRCLRTMMNEWDTYNVDETTAARTIFVNNAGLTATDFGLTPAQKNELFINGVRAATRFIIEMSDGGVPRNAQQAQQVIESRRLPSKGQIATTPTSGVSGPT